MRARALRPGLRQCDTLAALAVSVCPERLFSSAGSLSSGTKRKVVTTSFESWLDIYFQERDTIFKCKEPGVSHPAHQEYWHDEFLYGNEMKYNFIQNGGGGVFILTVCIFSILSIFIICG